MLSSNVTAAAALLGMTHRLPRPIVCVSSARDTACTMQRKTLRRFRRSRTPGVPELAQKLCSELAANPTQPITPQKIWETAEHLAEDERYHLHPILDARTRSESDPALVILAQLFTSMQQLEGIIA